MYSKLHDKQAVQFVGIESEVGQSIIATFQDDLQQMDTVYFVNGISVRTKSSAVILCLKMMRFPYRLMAFLMCARARLRAFRGAYLRTCVHDLGSQTQ